MPDTSLAVEGKDTSIVITYDGIVIQAYESVGFKAEPIIGVTRTKPLGTTTVFIDTVPEGWKVQIDIETSKKAVDELMDVIISAETLRLPGVLAVQETTRYRDLTSKSYLYVDLKVTGAPREAKRGQATTYQLQMETGINRIAV